MIRFTSIQIALARGAQCVETGKNVAVAVIPARLAQAMTLQG